MAIAPIDLQTLFSQVDKVGRTQAAQKEGQALAQSIQGAQLQKKTEEHIKQVNEAQSTGEGTDKINDHNRKQNPGEKNDGKKHDKNEIQDEEKLSVVQNPYLGNKIDISL